MKTKLVRIGNSRGVRLPKPLIEEAGLADEIELRVLDGSIVITPADGPRSDWEDAARRLRERGEDRLQDEVVPTRFEDDEWKW